MSLKKEKEKKETSGMATTKLTFALINHILKINHTYKHNKHVKRLM